MSCVSHLCTCISYTAIYWILKKKFDRPTSIDIIIMSMLVGIDIIIIMSMLVSFRHD